MWGMEGRVLEPGAEGFDEDTWLRQGFMSTVGKPWLFGRMCEWVLCSVPAALSLW